MDIKICTTCKLEKEIEYYSWKIKSKNIRQTKCKECVIEYNKIFRAEVIKKEKIILSRKICNKCHFEKDINDFPFKKEIKDGHSGSCKSCSSDINKNKYQEIGNIEKRKLKHKKVQKLTEEQKLNKLIYRKEYEDKNRDNINKKRREKRNTPEGKLKQKEKHFNNKEKNNQRSKDYQRKNKIPLREKANIRRSKRWKEDPLYKFKENVRCRISAVFFKKGYGKKSRTQEILGCTYEEFRIYIESKFEPWISWSCYGNWNGVPTKPNEAWDFDHFIPISSAKTEEDVIRLNHYTNLQPLCSYVNRYIKKDNIL